ncbi:hypothetical protein [Plastoroseomonas hellenica]|uniref:Lipoprotein n=1 Tax=Plastoroseomonas hellenica TaxID=2687306 RepID=A0ABS5F703_9PROT|nr:hypothetical protein [Plastoroseomonas hellenica]MBR0646877.1 hypothetical protein [Plastoroseomonas hellenica]MBR0668345.1 hypothetical protein [Plastoroseomonas hellenica]
MRNPLIRLAVIATAAIGLSACVAYPVGHRHHGYYGGGGYYRDYGPPRNYVYRDGYGYGRGYGRGYYR